MSRVIRLKKGLDIKIIGPAAKTTDPSFESATFALKPTDFHGIAPIPKLLVGEGDEVLAGDPIFFDKSCPEVRYSAPVSGEIAEIRRGEKRAITEVVILADRQPRFREFNRIEPQTASREQIVQQLLDSGAWTMIRQRPYNVVPTPADEPRAIYISGFDSAPHGPDYDYVLAGRREDFQAGINALRKLTDGVVYLGLKAGTKPVDTLNEASGVEVYWFDGPHPAGNVGIQIHHIDPILKGDTVWTVGPLDVATIGRLFREGRYEPTRMVAVTGPEMLRPRYVKTYLGANVERMIRGHLRNEHVRVVSGNLLSGTQIESNGHLGFFDNQISVVEEGDRPELLGWLLPSYPRPTASKAFAPILNDIGEGFRVNTNTHGEERAFVMSGEYEAVLPMDIYPVHLLKAILTRDFDLMEGLGLYEVVEEDLALCEFVCTSKMDVQEILRDGLDYLRSQG